MPVFSAPFKSPSSQLTQVFPSQQSTPGLNARDILTGLSQASQLSSQIQTIDPSYPDAGQKCQNTSKDSAGEEEAEDDAYLDLSFDKCVQDVCHPSGTEGKDVNVDSKNNSSEKCDQTVGDVDGGASAEEMPKDVICDTKLHEESGYVSHYEPPVDDSLEECQPDEETDPNNKIPKDNATKDHAIATYSLEQCSITQDDQMEPEVTLTQQKLDIFETHMSKVKCKSTKTYMRKSEKQIKERSFTFHSKKQDCPEVEACQMEVSVEASEAPEKEAPSGSVIVRSAPKAVRHQPVAQNAAGNIGVQTFIDKMIMSTTKAGSVGKIKHHPLSPHSKPRGRRRSLYKVVKTTEEEELTQATTVEQLDEGVRSDDKQEEEMCSKKDIRSGVVTNSKAPSAEREVHRTDAIVAAKAIEKTGKTEHQIKQKMKDGATTKETEESNRGSKVENVHTFIKQILSSNKKGKGLIQKRTRSRHPLSPNKTPKQGKKRRLYKSTGGLTSPVHYTRQPVTPKAKKNFPDADMQKTPSKSTVCNTPLQPSTPTQQTLPPETLCTPKAYPMIDISPPISPISTPPESKRKKKNPRSSTPQHGFSSTRVRKQRTPCYNPGPNRKMPSKMSASHTAVSSSMHDISMCSDRSENIYTFSVSPKKMRKMSTHAIQQHIVKAKVLNTIWRMKDELELWRERRQCLSRQVKSRQGNMQDEWQGFVEAGGLDGPEGVSDIHHGKRKGDGEASSVTGGDTSLHYEE